MEEERKLVIDLTQMPTGEKYEERYGKYLEIFHRVATTPADIKVVVVNPPASWWPLFKYLGCWIRGKPQIYFDHCHLVKNATYTEDRLDRTAIEVLCGFRPETVDALWKIDMQWKVPLGRVGQGEFRKEFVVTCNGSFFRQEVLHYLKNVLPSYTPTKRKVVIVPCAADKPYPSRVQRAVLERIPDSYYLATVSGTLGITPQDLWPEMPHYDAGLPNYERVVKVLEDYFSRFDHERIVVYSEYYGLAIQQVFRNLNQLDRVVFIHPVEFYYDYLDLASPERLRKLERAFENERVEETA